MTDSFVSRGSVPVEIPPSIPEGKIDTTVKGDPIKAELPLEKWVDIKGVPYTVEYLGINIWNEDTKRDVDAIEGYISNEIKQKGLEPTPASYREIMEHVSGFLQISPNTREYAKFEKIAGYVRLIGKYRKIEDQKKRLLKELNEIRGVEYG